MTSSHYNNIIEGTLGDMGLEHLDDPAYAAKSIFGNCGVAFPEGDAEAVLAVLKGNDYVGWRSCTAQEAQENANEGVAAVAISNGCMTVIKPEERAVSVRGAAINPMANYSLARTVDQMDGVADVEYFAYSASRITVVSEVYASVSAVNSPLTDYQMTCNAKFIYKRLLNCGFTKNAICAVLGNMERESSKIDPGIWQKLNNTQLGYGLVQWTPASDKFLKWASEEGGIKGATTPSVVNDFARRYPKELMDKELTYLAFYTDSRQFFPSKDPRWNNTEHKMSFTEFKRSTLSTDILAIVFHDHFERSSDTISEVKRYRCVSAIKWFRML